MIRLSTARAAALALVVASTTSSTEARADEAPRTVRVHVDSPEPVTVWRRQVGSDGARDVEVCSAPCDTELPVGEDYVIRDSAGRPAGAFHLGPKDSNTTVHIDFRPKSRAQVATGTVLSLVGPLFLCSGFGITASSAGAGEPDTPGEAMGRTVGPVVERRNS